MRDIPASKGLTPKQKVWAEHYAESGNALQSAVSAGYSPVSARSQSDRMLKNAEVMRYVSSLTDPGTNARIASATEMQEFLTSVVRGEIRDVATGGKELEYIETPAPLSERRGAAELLAKMRGDLAPIKLDITARVQSVAQVWVAQVLSVIEQEAGTEAAQRILQRLPVLELEGK